MKKTYPLFLAVLLAVCVTCGSIPDKIEMPEPADQEEEYVEKNYKAEDPDTYAVYLVDLEEYTTNGDYYHKKHEEYLKGIAEIMIERHNYRLREGTIGFYFDKVENKRDNLYLGLDLICNQNVLVAGEGYHESGRRMIREYLENILKTVHRYEDILQEKQVEGAVIGLQWYSAGRGEVINIWMSKQDIKEYFNEQLTFNQLVLKATITDKSGKKIRLTL